MDSYLLTGPDGRVVNLGSWLRADPGPDFGAKDLLKVDYSETPAVEGGVFGFEAAGVRRMMFPVRLASLGAFGGLAALESTVRALARPGAVLDLMPDGVATADAVRFDVLAGRLEEDYDLRVHRVGRRDSTVKLEVGPFGYSPTWITLASAASVGLPGVLTIPNASITGDVAGLAELVVAPTSATSYAAGTWLTDMLGWSLAGRGSFAALIPASAISSSIAGGLVGEPFVAGSQVVNVFPSPTQAGWTTVAFATIGAGLEPAYRGRFRAFAFVKLTPSQALPWTLSMDAVGGPIVGAALGSAQPVATLAPAVSSGVGFGAQPSPAYNLVDLGELTLPPAGSGLAQDLRLRLWANPATSNVGVATPVVGVGGFYLLPLDGAAGILARGLAQPTISTPSVGRLALDAFARRSLIGAPTGDLATTLPVADALVHHRGGRPLVGASTLQLDLLGGHRFTGSGATAPLVRSAPGFAAVSVRYRPRFLFLKGV